MYSRLRLALVTTVLAVLPGGTLVHLAGPSIPAARAETGAGAIPRKDPGRLAAAPPAADRPDTVAVAAPVRVAFGMGPPEPDRAGFGPPPPHGFDGPPPFGGARPAHSPRAMCEARIDHRAGAAAVLRSRLALTDAQRQSWQRIEDAREPHARAQRALCAELPGHAASPPPAPARLRFHEKMTAAELDELRAVMGPTQALYDQLTPSQRELFDGPPGPRPRH